jgi:hypothetical protein
VAKTISLSADFSIQVDGFKNAARDLKAAGPQFKKQLNAGLKGAVSGVVADAKSNADFSPAIARSIRSSASSNGVSIVAGGNSAPAAAAFENNGLPGTFKHPVFGSKTTSWVNQKAHPFLAPAINANVNTTLLDAAQAAMDQVLLDAGFK